MQGDTRAQGEGRADPPSEAEALCSFDHLPDELRLKCLANCDWQTLSRASCASRATRALVAYLVRTPYWRTYSEEQPAVLSTEFATAKEGEAACGKWAAGLTARLCGRGKPDICFVFVSARSIGNLPLMLKALRANLASCTLLAGVVAPGVLGLDSETGNASEIDNAERMGLVVSVLHLPPGSSVHAALVTDGLQRQYANPAWHAPQGVLPKGPSKHPRTWLVLSDQHAQLDELLHEMGRCYPQEPVCGGMGGASETGSSMLVGLPGRGADQPLHADVTSGSLLIAISGPGVEAVPMSTRGMRCISQRFMVSQVSPNVDLSPVGRVTLVQQMQNSVSLATGSDKLTWVPVGSSFTPTSALVAALQAQGANVAPRAPLFFGVRSPGTSLDDNDPGKMVMLQMHDPNNLMRTSGFVSVQHPVTRGMVAAFFTPQPTLSKQQLQARLEAVAQQAYSADDHQRLSHHDGFRTRSPATDSIHRVLGAQPSPVVGCLMFPCVAKGRRYYEDQDVEVKMVQAAMPGAEICGFFCNGEIGPAPADELGPDDVRPARMMGYSTVMCLLKLSPAPPPPPGWHV